MERQIAVLSEIVQHELALAYLLACFLYLRAFAFSVLALLRQSSKVAPLYDSLCEGKLACRSVCEGKVEFEGEEVGYLLDSPLSDLRIAEDIDFLEHPECDPEGVGLGDSSELLQKGREVSSPLNACEGQHCEHNKLALKCEQSLLIIIGTQLT